jgi:SAM-dependent MidA family methyltransferase
VVREVGAGRGTLATSVRAGLVADRSRLHDALIHQPVDLVNDASDEAVVGCLLANEFLDALPVHRVTVRDGRLQEVFVAWRDGWFADELGEPSTPALEAQLADDGVRLAEGAMGEVSLEGPRWVERMGSALERGYLLLIDYGHEAADLYSVKRRAGTLLGYRAHRVEDDPYRSVGRMDLTAHVDLTAVRRAARRVGLEEVGSTTLGWFVERLGLGDLLHKEGTDPSADPQRYMLARSAVARMLHPRHLGGFRVLAWARGAPAGPLRGFGEVAAGGGR